MTRTLVISDIHGCYDELIELLDKVNYDNSSDKLVLNGDYIDRGSQNLKALRLVKELKEEGAIVIKGNHDQMFYDYATKPYYGSNIVNYLSNGGIDTVREMVEDFDSYVWHNETYAKWAAEVMTNYPELVDFIQDLDLYHETESHLFVHAGINPFLKDWKLTETYDFYWIRDQFLHHDHNLDKTIVHGHTPNLNLHGSHDVYFGRNKIGIDGACAYGGQLNCLVINEDGSYEVEYVD